MSSLLNARSRSAMASRFPSVSTNLSQFTVRSRGCFVDVRRRSAFSSDTAIIAPHCENAIDRRRITRLSWGATTGGRGWKPRRSLLTQAPGKTLVSLCLSSPGHADVHTDLTGGDWRTQGRRALAFDKVDGKTSADGAFDFDKELKIYEQLAERLFLRSLLRRAGRARLRIVAGRDLGGDHLVPLPRPDVCPGGADHPGNGHLGKILTCQALIAASEASNLISQVLL